MWPVRHSSSLMQHRDPGRLSFDLHSPTEHPQIAQLCCKFDWQQSGCHPSHSPDFRKGHVAGAAADDAHGTAKGHHWSSPAPVPAMPARLGSARPPTPARGTPGTAPAPRPATALGAGTDTGAPCGPTPLGLPLAITVLVTENCSSAGCSFGAPAANAQHGPEEAQSWHWDAKWTSCPC